MTGDGAKSVNDTLGGFEELAIPGLEMAVLFRGRSSSGNALLLNGSPPVTVLPFVFRYLSVSKSFVLK